MRRLLMMVGLFVVLRGGGVLAQQPSQGLGIVTCSVTAVPAEIDAQQPTTPLGDIVLTCVNTPPHNGGFAIPNRLSLEVVVYQNVPITDQPPTPGQVSTAVLTINDNGCASPSTTGATFGSCAAPDGRFQDPQSAEVSASNELTWTAVDFPVPGGSESGVLDGDCSDGGCFPLVTTIRISGLQGRVDATQISALVFIRGPITIRSTYSVVNVGELSAPVSAPYDNPPPLETGAITCITTANPAAVDPAGLDERVGPILLECALLAPPSGISAATSLTFDLGVRLTTDFSGPTRPGPNGSTLTVATLVIDGDEANAGIGELEGSNQIKFRGLTLPIAREDNGKVFQIAVENLSSNVSQLGIPKTATFPATGTATAFATSASSPAASGSSTPTATGRLTQARTFAAGASRAGRRSPGPGNRCALQGDLHGRSMLCRYEMAELSGA